jgi:hypothetical protein
VDPCVCSNPGANEIKKHIMILCRTASWAVVFAIAFGFQKVEAASPSAVLVSPSDSVRNERAVLKYLWPALGYGEKAARIYYGAICQQDPNIAASFPRLDVRSPLNERTGVAAFRDVFRSEKDISRRSMM